MLAVQTSPPKGTENGATALAMYVALAQADDSSAFEELVRRTEGLARKTAFPLLPRHLVDDAVQESYLIVYRKLHHLQKPEYFQAWLARIVLHVCYQLRRKAPPLAVMHDQLPGSDSTASVAAKLDLRAALEQLKEDDRDILVLREFLSFSYEEISYISRLPIGTVRSRIHYARKKLKTLLA